MTKIWLLGGSGGCVLLIVLSWLLVVSPALSRVSSVKSQISSADSANDLLKAKIAGLQAEEAQMPTLRKQLLTAVEGLPPNSGLSDYTAQLEGQAQSAHVHLTSITAASPVVVGSTSTSSTPAATSTSTTSTSTTTSTTASAAVTTGVPYAIPMTIVADGDLGQLRAFLDLVQVQGPRRSLVTSTNVAPASSGTAVSIDTSATMTVQLYIFTIPETTAQRQELLKLLGLSSTGQ